MSKKLNASSIKGLVKNLSDNYEKEYEPIVSETIATTQPKSTEAEEQSTPPLKTKEKASTTGIYVRLPKMLASKLRSLSSSSGFTVKDIVIESLTNTISRYEKQFGPLEEKEKPNPRNIKDVIQ